MRTHRSKTRAYVLKTLELDAQRSENASRDLRCLVRRPSASLQRSRNWRTISRHLLVAALNVIPILGCNATLNLSSPGTKATTHVTLITISPSIANLLPGQSLQFSTSVSGSSSALVNWAVNGVPGGNSGLGTISAGGMYSAPSTPPAAGEIVVTATSVADGSANASATITIQDTITISPASVSLPAGGAQQFTATVDGANNPTVVWMVGGIKGGNNTLGTISSTGVYTAPILVPISNIVVAAEDASDSLESATAAVTIHTPLLTISPTVVSLSAEGTQQFAATIDGGGGSSVIWTVGGVAGGNSTLGTISSTGLYTAPTLVPDSPVTVVATDPSDTLVTATATITVLDPAVAEEHNQWLAGLADAAASFGCTSISVQQLPSESVSDAVSLFVQNSPEQSCLALWPISTDPTSVRYSFAWGGKVNGKDILYISDLGQMRIWNGVAVTSN
jgi:hypothetical protein